MIAQSVRNGLRATLRTGNLLTGQLFVDLDMQKDAPPAEVAEIGGYRTLPTVSSGLGQLQDKLTAVLDKIQALKLEDTVNNASGALAEIKSCRRRPERRRREPRQAARLQRHAGPSHKSPSNRSPRCKRRSTASTKTPRSTATWPSPSRI